MVYEEAFAGAGAEPEVFHRVADMVALRFPDPLQRKDRAGRIIPHDFVLFGAEANDIGSVADGRRLVWQQVADEFSRVWELSKPPSAG
ncbi:hypothetical protein QNO08_02980 [Arthrobacter sp. zg-Y820]|uniref:hypothetical protein n=1 Tax=unclassified Arthrobacter TaxID=235627 RepID=UPI001E46F663|nr:MULTISPECIES: hypothetical protein [unclassified Arthrobacter]MCC9195297.1 hypothetical protein [Arthrobacter sp. zg-Y820]MDK1278156.1 hypothetical protein [Arthrobacter sp. zg.Y820]MDK1361366.1 hypothetical protein [Arthrobacter sp. zg-Y1219]WIB10043.1 hypothetical protein QNO08_02980 [Arthrobacter sp. zg-Y820]